MRIPLTILSFFITLAAFTQQPNYPDSGFTNKVEAKNLMVNGKKEGKWIEYIDVFGNSTSILKEAYYYNLTIYKEDKPYGVSRQYSYKVNCLLNSYPYKDGVVNGIVKFYYECVGLHWEVPFKNGKENGLAKEYNEKGKLITEVNYINGIKNGESKSYYYSGELRSKDIYIDKKREKWHESYYKNGNIEYKDSADFEDSSEYPKYDVQKEYYENGKLKSETHFSYGNIIGVAKTYDENGNEIRPSTPGLPSTEVYLIDIQKKGDVFSLADSSVADISNNKGYDNQPVFIEKLNSIAYVSERNNKATDVYLYDIKTKETTQFTNNTEAEYSPKLTPDGKYISVVKGAEQNLTRVSFDGSVTEKIYTCKDSIGYYCWLNENEIAAVVLTNPVSLKRINIKVKTEEFFADSIGRSLFKYENGLAFCQTKRNGNWIAFLDADALSADKQHLKDKAGRQYQPIYKGTYRTWIQLPQGTEDFYITEDGWIFSSNGSTLVYCNAKEVSKGWRVLADLKAKGIPKIFRISVNKAENKLAFVAEGI
jgi:antitoxin component YwqK of YwqJK toxin-antitoxin module